MNEELTNELTKELNKSIQKAALDGTLTQKAVEQFNSLLKANDSQQNQLSSLRTDLELANKDCDELKKELGRTRTELTSYRERDENLKERESQHEVLQMTVKYEQKRVEDHREMVKFIFRNTTIRKEVMTPLRGSEGIDQYNAPLASGYASKDVVEEEDL